MYSFHFVLLYYLSNTIIQMLASVKHNCEKMIQGAFYKNLAVEFVGNE